MEASEQQGTPAVAGKEAAWDAVRDAQASWAGAMRAHELAPPDPRFRSRLQALSRPQLQCAMRTPARSRGYGVATGRRVQPRETAVRASPWHGPAWPKELWTRFDAAVERLNLAGAGEHRAEIVAAYSAVAEARGSRRSP